MQNGMGQWDEAIWMSDMDVESSNDYACGDISRQVDEVCACQCGCDVWCAVALRRPCVETGTQKQACGCGVYRDRNISVGVERI